MITTLNIDDDILQAAKEIAQREHRTAGHVISELARRALLKPATPETIRNGVPVLDSGSDLITLDHVQKIMDEEGI